MDDFAGLTWPSDSKSASSQQAKGSTANSPSGTSRPNYSPNLSSHSFTQQQQQQSRSASSLSKTSGAKDDPFGELVSFGSSQNNQAKMTLRERQQMLDQHSRSSSPFAATPLRQEMQQKKPDDMWNFDVLEKAGSSRSGAGTPAMQPPPPQQQQPQVKSNADFSAMDFDPLSSGKQTKSSFAPSSLSGYSGANLLDDDEPIPMDITPPPQAAPGPPRNTTRPMKPQQNAPEPFIDRDFEIAQIAGYGFTTEQAKAALEITGSTRAAVQLLREQQSTAQQMSKQQHQEHHHDSSSDDDAGYSPRDNRHRPQHQQQQQQQPMSFFGNKGGADALLSTANELGSTMWKQANSWFAIGKKKIVEMQETVMDQRRAGGGAGRGWRDEDYLPSQQHYRDSSSSDDDDDADMYVSAYRRRQHEQQRQQPDAVEERGRPASKFAASGFDESFIDMNGGYAEPASRPAPPKPQRQQQQQQQQPPRQQPSASKASVPATPPAAPIPALPAHVLQGSHSAKTKANEQFKLGQFGDAIAGYTEAVGHVTSSSPEHPMLILLLNNRALAYARNGESKNALVDCTRSLELCEHYRGNGAVELGAGAGRVDVADQRAKALQRRGEAYEAEEKYDEALGDWKRLREAARDSGMRQQAARGVQRCSKALGIGQPAATAAPAAKGGPGRQNTEDLASVFASISLSNVKGGGPHALNRLTESSAAVAEMRRKEEARRVEDDERLAIIDQVDVEIRVWRDGKQQNLRALLSSLHTLLPAVPAIGMHEILEPGKVKRAYMRAIARLHPDKLAKDADLRTRMVSASVFSSLNEAWDVFKQQEGQQ
ncbi:auxilin-like clathrin-binding protein required for normal clathrin function [Coemansia erecta]|uniref:Auxilin-like clathrin-binding protein required for normal clathrin function n=1 Tax=Coemansia erecta TaxID=147472 RepID=A0A9W8CQ70_9FUNG|nr:auxilin-like clathrin-binding protein required for normal clathrin function [Coemansia erecta]